MNRLMRLIPESVRNAVGIKAKLYALFLEKNEDAWLQFIRYIFVGGCSFLADTGTLLVTSVFIKEKWIYVTIGFTVGVTVNYILSKWMVFQKKHKRPTVEFLSVFLISVIGLLLTNWLFGLFYALFELFCNEYVTRFWAKVFSAALVLIWNFCARKVFYAVCDWMEKKKE